MAKDDPEIRQLRAIERELRAIEDNTSSKHWILHGILYGIGWILGSLAAVLLIGWILSILGVIPGLDRIAQDLNTAFTQVR